MIRPGLGPVGTYVVKTARRCVSQTAEPISIQGFDQKSDRKAYLKK
jgi:hypothetical protein